MKSLVVAALSGIFVSTFANAQVIQMPTLAQMAPSYPERALRMGTSGTAAVRCVVKSDGSLDKCVVTHEDPGHQGFGFAATKVAQRFVKAKRTSDGGEATVEATFAWNAH